MEAQIQKWGNSLGIRIPAKVAGALCLEDGKVVDIKIEGDHISIYPRKYDLNTMLKLINQSNVHREEFYDEVVGKEIL